MSITIDLNDVGYELTYWLNNKDLLVKTNKANAILVCAHAARWIVLCSDWENIRIYAGSEWNVNGVALANILGISQDDMLKVLETGIVTPVWSDDRSVDDEDEDAENANAENAEVSDDPC